MKDNKFNIAVLIDGDNAQAKQIKEIIEEVSKYGKATIRRIYGDWTSRHMNSWKDKINQHSISPIQKFAYTTGKNSTDSLMIIDAMDILHSKSVEGFCIVSSDSDYTGLAKRIREEGLFVMGIGRKITPIAFVNSCEIFTFSENLAPDEEEETTATKPIVKQSKTSKQTKEAAAKVISPPTKQPANPQVDLAVIDKAFEISTHGEEVEAYISQLGLALRKIDPSFDARTYGFRTLTLLFGSLKKYIVVKNEVNGLNHPMVRLR
jgi:uncharacterized LabA/DUF88 family protein